MSFTHTARTAIVAAISAAALATAAHPAAATMHSPTDDLTATPCKIDTAPGAPSCSGEESAAETAADDLESITIKREDV